MTNPKEESTRVVAREWWIGRTADGFDKWLTSKHPSEEKCRNVFISTDGSDPCVEYIAAIEKSAVTELEKTIESLEHRRAELLDSANRWASRAIEAEKAVEELKREVKDIAFRANSYSTTIDRYLQLNLGKDETITEMRKALELMSDWPTMADMTSDHAIGTLEQREDVIAWFIKTARETLAKLGGG